MPPKSILSQISMLLCCQEMLDSLNAAIIEAHGSRKESFESLHEMNALEFFILYAPNGIRFCGIPISEKGE